MIDENAFVDYEYLSHYKFPMEVDSGSEKSVHQEQIDSDIGISISPCEYSPAQNENSPIFCSSPLFSEYSPSFNSSTTDVSETTESGLSLTPSVKDDEDSDYNCNSPLFKTSNTHHQENEGKVLSLKKGYKISPFNDIHLPAKLRSHVIGLNRNSLSVLKRKNLSELCLECRLIEDVNSTGFKWKDYVKPGGKYKTRPTYNELPGVLLDVQPFYLVKKGRGKAIFEEIQVTKSDLGGSLATATKFRLHFHLILKEKMSVLASVQSSSFILTRQSSHDSKPWRSKRKTKSGRKNHETKKKLSSHLKPSFIK